MKKIIGIAFLLSCILVSVSMAQPNCVTKGNYLAAISEDLFEEATGYLAQKDYVALQKILLSGSVILLRPGVSVYVEDTKLFSGKIKIRPAGFTTSVWTNIEAVDCK